MKYEGVRTQLCRCGTQPKYAAGGTLRSCALVHKETKEVAGAKPTVRLHSEVAESSVTLT